jgi:selenocysteine lyase/cysteine desulfurase
MATGTEKGSLAPRADYPVLEEVTYFNTASFGLPPLPVQRAAREFDEQIAARGTVGFDDAAEALVYDGAREAVARLIGAGADEVAIVGSVTEALGQLAWWLKPGAGDNVVSTTIEFPSVTYPWLRVAQESGMDVRLVDPSDDPASLSIEDVAKLVDERTSVICISHVQYGTGARLDPRALAELAHANDAILILDAYQSAGVVPLDVRRDDVDILVGGGIKWLCATPGSAFCYLRPELLERFNPAIVGWRSTVDPPSFDATRITLAPGARRMEFATMAYSAGIALAAAIEYLVDLGIENVLGHNLRLGSMLMDGLTDLGAEIQTPREDGARAGIVNARFPGLDSAEVTSRLNDAGLVVSPRLGGTRFSLHVFNEDGDVRRALAIVDEIVGGASGADTSQRRRS